MVIERCAVTAYLPQAAPAIRLPKVLPRCREKNGWGENRTSDTRIFSRRFPRAKNLHFGACMTPSAVFDARNSYAKRRDMMPNQHAPRLCQKRDARSHDGRRGCSSWSMSKGPNEIRSVATWESRS